MESESFVFALSNGGRAMDPAGGWSQGGGGPGRTHVGELHFWTAMGSSTRRPTWRCGTSWTAPARLLAMPVGPMWTKDSESADGWMAATL
jgi:hypothetical protein